MKLPAMLRPESLTALIDSREQAPLCLDPSKVEVATLATGDYSLRGLEHVVAIGDRFDQELSPRAVGRLVRAMIEEAQLAGLLPTAKAVVAADHMKVEVIVLESEHRCGTAEAYHGQALIERFIKAYQRQVHDTESDTIDRNFYGWVTWVPGLEIRSERPEQTQTEDR